MAKNVYSFGIIPIYRNKSGKLLFLLVRHLEGHTFRTGANGGHWAFPKGHPKDGEDSLSAAMREFKEETGIEEVEVIKDKKFEEHYSFSAHGTPVNKTVTYYLGIVGDSTVTIQEEELQDYAWVTYQDGLSLMTFEEGRDVLRQAHDYLVKYRV